MNRLHLILLLLILTFSVRAQEVISDKDFLLGKFEYRSTVNFVKVDKKYAAKNVYLNAVVYEAYKKMYELAKQEGIDLAIVSGTRNFFEQKRIWEQKWIKTDSLSPWEKTMTLLQYSAMPGTSRHHWGTDIDINSVEDSYFEKGRGKAVYDWLVKNAGKFGFFQVYTSQSNGRTGYREEKWHWSYMPLAAKYLKQYNDLVDYCEIEGFEGSEFAEEAAIIPDFVNGIPEYLHSPLPLTILLQSVVLLQAKE